MSKKTLLLLSKIGFAAYCFLSGGYLFFAAWGFTYDVGSGLAYLLPSLPCYLCFVALLPSVAYFLFFLIKKIELGESRKGLFLGFGVYLSGMGLAIVVSDVALLMNKTFDSLFSDRFTACYPFDTILFAFLACFLGGFLFYAGLREMRGEKRRKDPLGLFIGILMGIAAVPLLFYAGDLILSAYTFDRSFAHFLSALSVYLLMADLAAMPLYYLFRKKSVKSDLIASIAFLFVGAALVAYMLIAYVVDLYFINEALVANFPLDFMTSVNYGPLSLGLLAILIPAVSLGYSIFRILKARGRRGTANEGSE